MPRTTLPSNSHHPPPPFPPPSPSLLQNPKLRDEVKDWCIQVSMNQQIEQSLPRRRCPKCSQLIYEASLRCPECRMQFEPCVVSGPHERSAASCHLELLRLLLSCFHSCWCF